MGIRWMRCPASVLAEIVEHMPMDVSIIGSTPHMGAVGLLLESERWRHIDGLTEPVEVEGRAKVLQQRDGRRRMELEFVQIAPKSKIILPNVGERVVLPQ